MNDLYTRKHAPLGDLPTVKVHDPVENLTKIDFHRKSATIIFGKNKKGETEAGHSKAKPHPKSSRAQEKDDKMRLREKITESITSKTKTQIFNTTLDWSEIVKHNLLELKVRPFIAKKTIHYMGEEEKFFIKYVMGRLRKQDSAQKLIKKVYELLEDDSEEFVY